MVTIVNLDQAHRVPMGDRGETIHLVSGETGAKSLDVHVNILRAGGPDGQYHYHPESDNVYLVLEGIGRFVADGAEYQLRARDVVFIPAGVKHSLSARGDGELVLLEIYSPIPAAFVPVDGDGR